MKKFKNYENFEIGNQKDNNDSQNNNQAHLYAKIGVLLVLIIIFQIIYIICINSYLKEKNNELIDLNYKKYILENGNKKLYNELNEDLINKYSFEDKYQKLDKEIKRKEEEIVNYKKMSRYLLNNFNPTTEALVREKEKTSKKIFLINELKKKLKNSNKIFREKFNSRIIDSLYEIYSIELLTNKNNIHELKLCYNGEDNKIDISEAYNKCDLSRDIPFLIVLQTDKFKRYGIYISNMKENYAFVFTFNFEKKEMQQIELNNNNQRQSIIFLFNLIKNMKFDNDKLFIIEDKEEEIQEEVKDLKVTDLEIFYI